MSTHRPLADTLELRRARPGDHTALHRLAVLDSQAPPGAGAHLIAFAGGRPIAALALERQWHAADPFQQSNAALDLLRARRAQLCGPATRRPARALGRRVHAGAATG